MCKFVGLNVNKIEKGNKWGSCCESNNSNLGKDWDFFLSSLVPSRSVVTFPSNSKLVFCVIFFLIGWVSLTAGTKAFPQVLGHIRQWNTNLYLLPTVVFPFKLALFWAHETDSAFMSLLAAPLEMSFWKLL